MIKKVQICRNPKPVSDICGLSAQSVTIDDRKSAACWKSLPVVCGCQQFNA